MNINISETAKCTTALLELSDLDHKGRKSQWA